MRQKTVITKLLQNIPDVYYKVRRVLRSASSVTKCDKNLLQRASGITKCDKLLLQSASCITKCDKLLLQSASGITKCGSYYKVRRNSSNFGRSYDTSPITAEQKRVCNFQKNYWLAHNIVKQNTYCF